MSAVRIDQRRTALTWTRDSTVLLALVLPFVGQGFPYGFPLFFPTVCLAFGLAVLCKGWKSGGWALHVPVDGFLLLTAAVLMFYLYGMVLTVRLDNALATDVLNAIAVLLLYLTLLNSYEGSACRERLIARFMSVLFWSTIVIAIFGLVKFALLIRGERIAIVEAASPGGYPFGTSLSSDYNMFALVLLSGAIVALVRSLHGRVFVSRMLGVVAFLLLLGVGFLSGSRRFWVIAPLATLLVLGLSLLRLGVPRTSIRLGAIVLVVLGAWMMASAHLTQFQLGDMSGAATRGVEARLMSLLTGSDAFESRSVRWELAYELANTPRVWTGQGFDYVHDFSCRISDCRSIDYPHNPVLSALLYGGALAALSVIAFLIFTLRNALRILFDGWTISTVALLLVVHTPFILISSNSVLSVKSYLICAMLCCYLARPYHSPALHFSSDEPNAETT